VWGWEGEDGGQVGEMDQTMYIHMNKWIKSLSSTVSFTTIHYDGHLMIALSSDMWRSLGDFVRQTSE
jgi:hypothetical protein